MLVKASVIDLVNDLPAMIAGNSQLTGPRFICVRRIANTVRPETDMDVSAAELRDAAFSREHRREEERDVTLVPILCWATSSTHRFAGDYGLARFAGSAGRRLLAWRRLRSSALERLKR